MEIELTLKVVLRFGAQASRGQTPTANPPNSGDKSYHIQETYILFKSKLTLIWKILRPLFTLISEISLIAVNAKDLLDLHTKLKGNLNLSDDRNVVEIEGLLPRVINKLTQCVYPMTTMVQLVSDITGLENYNLSKQSKGVIRFCHPV